MGKCAQGLFERDRQENQTKIDAYVKVHNELLRQERLLAEASRWPSQLPEYFIPGIVLSAMLVVACVCVFVLTAIVFRSVTSNPMQLAIFVCLTLLCLFRLSTFFVLFCCC